MSNKGFNETLTVPINHKDSSAVSLRSFDAQFKTLNTGILSVAKNIGAMHGSLNEFNLATKSYQDLRVRVDSMEKHVASNTKAINDLAETMKRTETTFAAHVSQLVKMLNALPAVVAKALEPIVPVKSEADIAYEEALKRPSVLAAAEPVVKVASKAKLPKSAPVKTNTIAEPVAEPVAESVAESVAEPVIPSSKIVFATSAVPDPEPITEPAPANDAPEPVHGVELEQPPFVLSTGVVEMLSSVSTSVPASVSTSVSEPEPVTPVKSATPVVTPGAPRKPVNRAASKPAAKPALKKAASVAVPVSVADIEDDEEEEDDEDNADDNVEITDSEEEEEPAPKPKPKPKPKPAPKAPALKRAATAVSKKK
jgi:hypothetical protein